MKNTRPSWLIPFLASLVLAAGCTHAPASRGGDEEAQIIGLDRPGAESSLAATKKELDDVDEKLRTAEAQVNNFEAQVPQNPDMESAVEGARAEAGSLQTRRGILMHRQHLLEARLRELGWEK